MDGTQTPLDSNVPASPVTSLTARMTNVFVTPSEVFDEVKVSPPTPANWIVPLVLAMIAGIIYTMVVFSQPAVLQRMKDAQAGAMQKKVTAGKMTQQQADQALDIVQKYLTPSLLKVIGILSSIFVIGIMLFVMAAVLWVIGRFVFRGEFTYMQTVEVTGLATVINVLGVFVTMLTVIIYGDMSMTPGPILLIGHVDPANKVHLLLASLNVMSLWNLAVMGIGLARLSGASILKAVICVIGLWYAIWAFFALLVPMFFGGR